MESSADGDKAYALLREFTSPGEILDDCDRGLDVASVHVQLRTLTKETLIEPIASLAETDVGMRTALRDQTHMISEDEKGWHHKAIQEIMNSPLYYAAILIGLDEYLERGVPFNCAGLDAFVASAYDIE